MGGQKERRLKDNGIKIKAFNKKGISGKEIKKFKSMRDRWICTLRKGLR